MGRRRKKQDEAPPGLPPWMATFSDMVTLLLTFFVMLMAMANFDDNERVEAVLESLRMAMGVDGFDAAVIGISEQEAHTLEDRATEVVLPTVARLRQRMQARVSDAFIPISQNERELRFLLDAQVFFDSGSVTVHPVALPLLQDLAGALRQEEVQIEVHGYADATGPEQDNWRVSSERAVAVVSHLREYGPLDGRRLAAVGHGSFVGTESLDADVPYHRRVEFVVRADARVAAGVNHSLQAMEGP